MWDWALLTWQGGGGVRGVGAGAASTSSYGGHLIDVGKRSTVSTHVHVGTMSAIRIKYGPCADTVSDSPSLPEVWMMIRKTRSEMSRYDHPVISPQSYRPAGRLFHLRHWAHHILELLGALRFFLGYQSNSVLKLSRVIPSHVLPGRPQLKSQQEWELF